MSWQRNTRSSLTKPPRRNTHEKQQQRAIDFVEVLRKHGGPVIGYATIAELAGYGDRGQSRTSGQAAKMIDLACFHLGLPMLASTRILAADGEVNDASFPNMWESWKPEIVRAGEVYPWKDSDFDLIIAGLRCMTEGADKGWRKVERDAAIISNYIRAKLHARVWREICNQLREM
jgi:hypothetical protein